MTGLDRKIRAYFRIKRGDNLPYTGWLRSTRVDIYKIMASAGGFTQGAEIGVKAGHNAKNMFEEIPGLHLICIDPWGAYNRTSQFKNERYFERCKKRLFGCNATYLKMTSAEAINEIPDDSLDFVYIDGLHTFPYVMMDIIQWSKKVRAGGIVSGHDFFCNYQFGVVEAVRAYTYAMNIQDWYITTEDKFPSWFWVKTPGR